MSWRLVLLNEVDPYEVSIYPEMLMLARRRNIIPDTLYLFTFSGRSVTFGRGKRQIINAAFCESQNISILRIHKGTGVQYHDNGDARGFFIHKPSPKTSKKEIRDTWVNGVCRSLGVLGLEAIVDGNNVIVNGSKVGTLNLRPLEDVWGDMFSLLLDFDFDTAEKAIVSKHDMRAKMSTLKVKRGRETSFDEVAQAVKEGFEKALGVEFDVTDSLTDAEKEIVEGLREKYTSEKWIRTGRWSPVKEYWRPT